MSLQHCHTPANVQKAKEIKDSAIYLASQVGAYSINRALKCITALGKSLKVIFSSFRHPKA